MTTDAKLDDQAAAARADRAPTRTVKRGRATGLASLGRNVLGCPANWRGAGHRAALAEAVQAPGDWPAWLTSRSRLAGEVHRGAGRGGRRERVDRPQTWLLPFVYWTLDRLAAYLQDANGIRSSALGLTS